MYLQLMEATITRNFIMGYQLDYIQQVMYAFVKENK